MGDLRAFRTTSNSGAKQQRVGYNHCAYKHSQHVGNFPNNNQMPDTTYSCGSISQRFKTPLLCQQHVQSLTSHSYNTRRYSARALCCSSAPQQGILAQAQHRGNKVTEILSNAKILKATPQWTQDAENTDRGFASESWEMCLMQQRDWVEHFNSDITVISCEDIRCGLFIFKSNFFF